MPRAGQLKPESGRRLSDLVSVGVLKAAFPPELVEEVIVEVGVKEQRHRSLPAWVMAYYAMAMALYADGSYVDVLSMLTDGLSWTSGWEETWKLPTKSAISQARIRLGPEAVEAMFRQGTRPLATVETPGSFLAGRRLVAIDGTTYDLADSTENDGFFGRPGVNRGERSAFPQARVVALAECGIHAMFDAEIGVYGDGERELAAPIIDRLTSDMLMLADRGFYSAALWQQATDTGADLLWRISKSVKPHPIRALPDGSWIVEIRPKKTPGQNKPKPFQVRLIDYTVDNQTGQDAGEYRLVTTILDPDDVSAVDLAIAYTQRWEIESTFDELKTHQRGPRVVLRSKSPEMVRQEIWGHLCCHHAIRKLMCGAAEHVGRDPDRLSSVAALNISRASINNMPVVTQDQGFPALKGLDVIRV
ncbi:MAG: IS4 family transposase [Candidatus Nanopelagicales bacterium]